MLSDIIRQSAAQKSHHTMCVTNLPAPQNDSETLNTALRKHSRWYVNKAKHAASTINFLLSGRLHVPLLFVFLLVSSYNRNAQLFTTIFIPWSWQEAPSPGPKMCFVTAQFAAHFNSTDKLFAPTTKRKLYGHARFFAFTNLQDFQAPEGWEVILRTYPQYKRSITQSRVPKFQGFHDPVIYTNCQVVFYLDGSVDILGSLIDFESDAQRIIDSNVGLMQPLHPRGNNIHNTFEEIRKHGKDTQHNLKLTRQWFHQQPDYIPEIQVYHNMYFGYDVRSTTFQKVADYFWRVYCTETGSWRDQPLWAYMLHHFNVTPLDFKGSSSDEDNCVTKIMFKRNVGREGMNGHTYATRLQDDQKNRSIVYSSSHKEESAKSNSPINQPESVWSRHRFMQQLCRLHAEKKMTLAESFVKQCDEFNPKVEVGNTTISKEE
jgi:hypothetical protein